jgi:hypothetical protein
MPKGTWNPHLGRTVAGWSERLHATALGCGGLGHGYMAVCVPCSHVLTSIALQLRMGYCRASVATSGRTPSPALHSRGGARRVSRG